MASSTWPCSLNTAIRVLSIGAIGGPKAKGRQQIERIGEASGKGCPCEDATPIREASHLQGRHGPGSVDAFDVVGSSMTRKKRTSCCPKSRRT